MMMSQSLPNDWTWCVMLTNTYANGDMGYYCRQLLKKHIVFVGVANIRCEQKIARWRYAENAEISIIML